MDILSSDSDWESSIDSGSSDGTEELEFLYHGHANNILSSLEETIGKIDDFLSFEREFTRGDIVQSVSDPHGQMGKVIKVNTFVDLENVHGKIIKDVDSKKLLKIRTISEEDYVVQGPWIGRVINVVDKVSVLFEDGTKCEVLATDNEKPMPLSPNLLEDSSHPYYPGQRVQFGLSTASKSARWLCGAWKENHNVGTIIAVKAGLVDVHWLACAIVGSQSFPSPQRSQDAENLTLLSCFSHENWRLGDWCILPKADSKDVKETIAFRGSILELIKEHRNLGKGFKKHDCHSNLEEIFSIVRMKTMVDVVWQDGDCSLGLDSESLLPIDTVNAHEFWPGQFMLEKGICDDSSVSGNQKWGVVIAVDSKEQTVKVKWKSDGVSQENDGSSNQKEEIVSAYELVEHPDYTFCFGDVVFRNTNLVDKFHVKLEKVSAEDVAYSGKGSGADQIGCPYEDFLSCIGHVTGFKNGSVEVTWASGVQTEVAPYHIFQINKYEGLTSPLIGQDGEASQQDMVDQEKQVPIVKTKELVDTNSIGKEQKRYSQECTSFFLPQSTIGFFKGIAASIFGSFASTSLSGSISTGHVSKEEKGELEAFDLSTEMQPLVSGQIQRCENTSVKEVIDDIPDNEELESSSSSLIHRQFKQFDMVGDCSDHHFLDCLAKGVALSQVKKGWLKKVQQEWSVLEKDLPESIYVRIYEERMDLIRAAIIGAPGTPYHDALFFFDIYLPPEYPHEPPLVHYRSGGLCVNPNLYESGKVCLSLLNTWQGTGTEVWNPESSNILQVLLSLQALVLNEKPYFNEAGYDKQMGRAEGEKNSVSYNENAFLATWKSMLYLLRNPPKHFKELVEEHVRQRSHYILSSCKAYLEGAPLAFALECGQTEDGDPKGSSTGFKIMLAKLLPKLVEAFSGKEIDCSQFTQLEN